MALLREQRLTRLFPAGGRIQIDRPIQKLVPLEVNLPLTAKEEEVRLHNHRLKWAAKTDANWRMQLKDQLLDQLD